MEEEEEKYTWEAEYERPWESIQEDIEGHLVAPDDGLLYKSKRRKLFHHKSHVKLGMMRHLVIILDSTQSMQDKDLRPDRFTCSKVILEKFFDEYFDQNPISQLSLVLLKDAKAMKISDLSCNSRIHKAALQQHKLTSGECSLQNGMELALKLLKHIPSHASKEVLIVHGSLRSCDPGNIFATIEEFAERNIRCSIVGLAGQIKLCQSICEYTNGSYTVILDETHYRDIMIQHCRPPAAKKTVESTLIKMGFPVHISRGSSSICMCHLDTQESLSCKGYFCPQCSSKYCELPVECITCGLSLVLAPHLSRSYHHLFPLEMFLESKPTDDGPSKYCFGCQRKLVDQEYVCPECNQSYCIDCDLYCHETLHNCPGCQFNL